MSMLNKIKVEIKSGDEDFTFENIKLQFKLIDFWKWSVSDIISNATRGILAEFIVATALKVDLNTPRDEWGSYDLLTPEGIKVEVKSAAYIQTWAQKDLSKIQFSVRPAKIWNTETNTYDSIPKRDSDVYVMCLLKHKDQDTINPLDLSQWTFYVISTKILNNYHQTKSNLSLKSVESLTNPIKYNEISDAVRGSVSNL